MKSLSHQLTKLSLMWLLTLTLWSAWTTLPIYAQGPTITGSEPISNTLNVTVTSNITVTFDMALDTATVTTQSLTLRGEQTGIYTGTYTFPATDTVVIDPAMTFIHIQHNITLSTLTIAKKGKMGF